MSQAGYLGVDGRLMIRARRVRWYPARNSGGTDANAPGGGDEWEYEPKMCKSGGSLNIGRRSFSDGMGAVLGALSPSEMGP